MKQKKQQYCIFKFNYVIVNGQNTPILTDRGHQIALKK